jgi:hypothetical protein
VAQNIIEEYLVKLGFAPTDTPGFARFAGTLRDAASLVDSNVLRMAKKFVELQVGATAGFAAIGAAALGIADKTAMADQTYRLLALHMFTTLPVARELKVALDALGQPLENVMWDPELAARFHQLVADQQTMTEQLGPGFEKQMYAIRDVRFEFTRFGVEIQYLTMNVVADLAKAFGTTTEGMLDTMRHFNEWFMVNIPFFANVIATKLKPVLIDVWDVLKKTGEVLYQIGVDFKDFPLEKFISAVTKGILALLQLEKNLALMFDAAHQAILGNFAAAGKDLAKMGPLFPEATPGGPAPILSGAGRNISGDAIEAAIRAQAKAFGVPPELALAVAAQESGFRQFDKSGKVLESNKGALGMMQLMPNTAAWLKVDPKDMGENILGGVELLSMLLKTYGGNQIPALEAYNAGKPGKAGQQYAFDVIGREPTFNITLNVDKASGTPEEIADSVWKIISEEVPKRLNRIQRNIGEFSTPGWSY